MIDCLSSSKRFGAKYGCGLGSRATALSDLLDDLDHFALYKDRAGFGEVIGNLKKDWINGAGADGASWVIAAIRKEGENVFPPESTTFEVKMVYNGESRIYDAFVSEPGQLRKFFEFKSYGNVPPNDFASQFVKDLNNEDIVDLSQLKWVFDAAKNPPNFEANMKAAIDGLDLSLSNIPTTTLEKLGVNGENGLRILIEQRFSTIFNLK